MGEKERKNVSLKTMNTVFSVDDFSDSSFFVAPASDAASGMRRSHSEWAFESFLEEFSGTGENNVIGPSLAPSQPSVSKAEEGDGNADVVEIKRPSNKNHNPLPTVPIDSDDYRAILKSKLELECVAVALSRRALAVKAEDSSAQADTHTLQSESKAEGSSKVQEQGETDVPPSGILVGSTSQKKSGEQVRQALSGSSREDSDSDEGDTETADNRDPANTKRARRMRSNRESARRSRRRKQVHMNELEGQVGQLRVEHSTLLKHLTDINHKYGEAAVDNRIMKADIETLRAKVKMAEETVKLTGFNPGLSRPNLPSVGMPFVSSLLEASTIAPLPLQSNANQFFHQPALGIVAPMHHQRVDNSFPGNALVPPLANTQTKGVKNVNRTSTLQHRPNLEGAQDQIGRGVGASGPIPGWDPGVSSHAADTNHKQS